VVLYGLGIFNPAHYATEECVFQPGFGCESFNLVRRDPTAGNPYPYMLTANFYNGLGYDILITKATLKYTDIGFAGPQELTKFYGAPGSFIGNGKSTPFIIIILGNEVMPAVGEVKGMPLQLAYLNCDASADYVAHRGEQNSVDYCTISKGATEHIIAGKITARIERG
jgi:hypothetical protein